MIDSKILRRRKGDRFIGLADIGSNTIHGVVYKVNNGDTTKILNHKDSTELISYICAGILSDEGIDRLCSEVKQLDDLFRLSECDEVDFFATSALRSAVNCDEALRIVREETGVCIRLIDGKQEFCRDAERLHGGKLLLILCACFVIIGRHEKQRLHVLV